MSKVRPKRGPRLSPTETAPPLVLETVAASTEETNSSTEYTSPTSSHSSGAVLHSSTANFTSDSASPDGDSHFSPLTKMFKHFPYSSDSGFGIMNPMFDEASEMRRLPDTPQSNKPFIPASQSLPIMPSSSGGLLSPSQMTNSICARVGSRKARTSARTPTISTPPNTPISPILEASQGAWVDRSNTSNVKHSNATSPNLATPPNTPLSNPLSPSRENTGYSSHSSHNSINSDTSNLYSPALAVEGQLYNILGNPVDLPNKKSPTATNIRISPTDPEYKLYPFPSYPSPPGLDSENEKVIKHLINLGNGIYDEGSKKRDIYKGPPEIIEDLTKSGYWDSFGNQTQIVAPFWTNIEGKPKIKNQLQREGDDDKTMGRDTTKSHDNRQNCSSPTGSEKEQISEVSCTTKKDRSPENGNENDGENKRNSLFADLAVPMIDEDANNGNLDSPTASVANSSSSSGKNNIDLLEEEVEELAEQLCDITNEAGRLISKELKEGISYLTKPEDTIDFTWIDTLTVIISIGLFYFDVVSDCSLAYNMYYDRDSKKWFTITVLFLIIPIILANAFSLYWYWFDERVCEPHGACYLHPKVSSHVWVFRVLTHLLLHGSVLRQIDILYYGTKSTAETLVKEAIVDEVMTEALNAQPGDGFKKNRGSRQKGLEKCSRRTGGVCSRGGYVALWIHAERDAANVDMLLSLVQDAPQLILHFYIMALTLPSQVQQGQFSQTLIWQILKEGFSFLSLAWSVTSFIRAIRLVEPTMSNLSLLDLLWLTLAHLFAIAGQVMSFALFASKFLLPFWVVAGSHWIVMIIWILIQLSCFPRTTCTRAVFAHDQRRGPCSKLDDVIYSIIMGFVFLFTFVDVGGISPRTQFFFFHVFRLIEQTTLLVIWFVWVNGSAWYHWLAIILVPVFSILNIFFDSIFCASTRPVTCLLLCKAPKAV